MNVDFLLFAGPKVKYKFIDLWGQVIFIPSYAPLSQKPKTKSAILFSEYVNCYKSNKGEQVQFTIQKALNDIQGSPFVSESDRTTLSNGQQQQLEQYITHYIPCLYLDSLVKSKYIILYFHASGQDIKIAQGLLKFLRDSYQTNVIAMEYQGYSIYKGSTNSQTVKKDSKIVYQYLIKKLGFKEQNIIVIGRSIGTGIGLQLLKNSCCQHVKNIQYIPRTLVLISPFSSIKDLARQLVGKIGTLLAKQHYNNIVNIAEVKCPVFIVHGKKDTLISYQHSQQLIEKCKTKKSLILPNDMTHSAFDYYSDLMDPLRQFMIQLGVNFYEQNMEGPQIPQQLYQRPQQFQI